MVRYADSVHIRNALPTAKAAHVTHRPSTTSAPRALRHCIQTSSPERSAYNIPEYADIYALSKHRTVPAITQFLDSFLPSRIPSADEYEIPQFSDAPTVVYTNAAELIRHCCENRTVVHAIYWRSAARCEHAMVFFLADEGLILGISTPADDAPRVDLIADQLSRHVGSDDVYVTYEDTPPESIREFNTLLLDLDPNPTESHRGTGVHGPIKGEPSRSLEPATGLDSNGESLPPAQ